MDKIDKCETRGYRIVAIILACQARDGGSIPLTRSTLMDIIGGGKILVVLYLNIC